MRTIVLGNKEIGLKATPLALLFYKQEFGADLIGDLTKMSGVEKDLSKLDIVAILQMVWAMNKAYNGLGKAFPPFTVSTHALARRATVIYSNVDGAKD